MSVRHTLAASLTFLDTEANRNQNPSERKPYTERIGQSVSTVSSMS